MDIAKIDKNFAEKKVDKNNEKFDSYSIPNDKADLYGVFYENGAFYRLSYSVAETISEPLKHLCSKTAGGRVRFTTDSRNIKIIARWGFKNLMNEMPPSAVSGFSLQEDFIDGSNRYRHTFVPQKDAYEGFESQYRVRGKKVRYYTLYFPLYNDLTDLEILVDKGSIFEKGLPYKEIKPILYYGSSITQGGCASRPDNSYQAIICKQNNVDFINLGCSGGCRAEEPFVKYMAGIDASIFVCDYDHNAPSVEFLKKTHFKLYETYRSKNPNTPILFITLPNYHTTRAKSPLGRLKVIKATYDKAIASGDKNVYFIDGRKLFKKEYNLCTVDGIHPNDIGFYFMAKTIGKVINDILLK